ncbi:MAG: DUF2089 family protein [Phycisphaerales bacterium]|nr:DUF2089 family protein [Phycisphaerales bacterium]
MSINESKTRLAGRHDHPLLSLSDEDLALVSELVLQSGSLKGLAEVYGVSYPTIRARLDRVIDRLQLAMQGRRPDPLREFLADLIERGHMNVDTARRIASLADERVNQAKGDA